MNLHSLRSILVSGLLLGGFTADLANAAPANTITANSTNRSNARLNVNFQKIDANGNAVVRYGTVLLTTQLAGIKLKSGASGVLAMLLPDGIRLQAEIVQKGAVPIVILWKGTTNMNVELLIQGVAQSNR